MAKKKRRTKEEEEKKAKGRWLSVVKLVAAGKLRARLHPEYSVGEKKGTREFHESSTSAPAQSSPAKTLDTKTTRTRDPPRLDTPVGHELPIPNAIARAIFSIP